MFKIGEFSKLTQVSIRMLRHYDEVGLLKPARIDAANGYRYYQANQIKQLNRILYLRDSGFLIQEIDEMLRQNQNDFLQSLDQKSEKIKEEIAKEQQKLRNLQIAKQAIQENTSLPYQLSIKAIPSIPILSYRTIISDYYQEGELWQRVSAFATANRLSCSQDSFTIYHDEEYKEQDVDVELCVPIKEPFASSGKFMYCMSEAVPVMASTMVYGDFSNIAGAYQEFASWLEQHPSYKMGRTSRQIVHRGPWNEADPDQYLIELQIPLTQR